MAFKDRFKETIIQPVESIMESGVAETSQPDFIEDLKRMLFHKLSAVPVWFEYSEDEKTSLIETFLTNYLKESGMTLDEDKKIPLVNNLLKSAYGFGELDLLLSDETVSSVIIKENEKVLVERNGNLSESDVPVKSVEDLCDKFLKIAGVSQETKVAKVTFRNLIATVIKPPVSHYTVVIKKKNREVTTFNYLVENGFVDEKIRAFLLSLLNNKKNILISGSSNSGKTSYAESFLEHIKIPLLLLETKSLNRESFVCSGLNDDEFCNLIDTLSLFESDYLICDLNNGFSDIEHKPLLSTFRAESISNAVSKLANGLAAKNKLTDKQAKALIASKFDYIIHLDSMYIASVSELSLNKSGSLILNEVITCADGQYSYDLPEVETPAAEIREITPQIPVLDGSFAARFR